MKENGRKNRRILVIDDNEAIHKDFREILGTADTDTAALDEAKAAILGTAPEVSKQEGFQIDSAFQGQEGLERIRQALHEGRPYAMAFVDVRMPPGWDGIETIRRIWDEYPQLQVVICTAYSDYQWQDIIDRLGQTDQLLILKKPFDNVEVRQLACALTEKWSLARQAESALGESEEKYGKLFGEAMDAIFVADAETGIIIDCNPAAARLIGREKTELVGQHQRILHPSEEIEGGFSKSFKQHVQEKQGRTLEERVVNKAGEIRDVAIKANVFELGGKKVIQGTFRDVTDRKKAEQAIRRSERFLDHVLNSIQDGISVLDTELNIVRVNDAIRLWYGHMLPLESKKCYYAYHGRSEPCEVCPTLRALQTGKIAMEEVSLTQADGVTGTLELFAFPILDDDGRAMGAVEYVRDVSDRKRAEEGLSIAARQWQTTFDGITDGVCLLDNDAKILECNRAMGQLVGKKPEEIIGQECCLLVHGSTGHLNGCPMVQMRDSARREKLELPVGDRWLQVTVDPLTDKDGSLKGAVHIISDITDRKRAEEELKEQDRLKSELVMNVSHELRTPLTIFKNIISNVLAGVMGRLNDKQRETLEIADREIDRLARIIGDFLDISKIETGKTKLNLAPLTIQSIVTETVNTRRLLLDDKNVELRTSMPDTDLLVNADRDRITQVLTNLIDNAIKFVPGCGGCITIRAKDLDDEVGIDVQDNGPGIEADDINKVFNRFVQIEKHVGPGSHGTGLGLAICRELIELHGGRIWAENVPTGGINFCLVLPKSSPDFENQYKTGDDCEHLPSACSRHEM